MRRKEVKMFGSHLEDCPPTDAETASGVVYRIVENNPPDKDDFIPMAKSRTRNFKGFKTPEQQCNAHGLSVFRNIQEALEAKDNSKHLSDISKPAVAELTPSCGLIKGGTSRRYTSHFTWWPPEDMEIWKMFEVRNL